jgi:hypothetical protein
MGKLSNNQIERIAVDAVRCEANHPKANLIPDISEGDKRVSFDGEISVHTDGSGKVESFLGKVSVQVKGKEVRDFSKGNITHPISLKHFKNFYKNSGVLFFVVQLKEDGTTKIFYRQLLLKELSQIIELYSLKKKQGSKQVELRPLSETSLSIVCRKFLNEQKNQPLMLIESNKYQDSKFDSYYVNSLTYDPDKEETSNPFDHDFIFYGMDKDLIVPLNFGRIDSVLNTDVETFEIGDNKYEFTINTTRKEHYIIREFEDALQMTYDTKNNKISITLLKFVSLSVQLKIISFLKSIFEHGKNYKNPHFVKWSKFINYCYGLLLDLQKIYKELNIPEEIEIERIDTDKSIYYEFELLRRLYIFDETEGKAFFENEMAIFFNYKVGNRLVLLFYHADDDKKRVINTFAIKINHFKVEDSITGKSYDQSPFIHLSAESLAFGLNIDFQKLMDSFDCFDPFANELVFSLTNSFILNCISAYDESHRMELLDVANYLINKYYKLPTYDPSSRDAAIVKINEMQIKERKEELLDEEKETLLNLKNQFPLNDFIQLHFCVNVLLKSKIEAKLILKKMESQMQEDFMKSPIFHLYNLLEQDTKLI